MPIVKEPYNRQRYWFIDVNTIWKFIPFKTSDKRKHRIMYFLLNCIQPKYILSMNWISQRESLYMVWTKKNPKSKFIVVQHGSYVGGIVTVLSHKYTKCDVFLVWGKYFVKQFNTYNSQKKVSIHNFGNPIYNTYNRDDFTYKNNKSNEVLLTPTALDKEDILPFNKLIQRLKELGFQVYVKEHNKQGREKDENGELKYPSIEGVNKIAGELDTILQNNTCDFIIADHSSALLDAIFFKNKVLYFDSNNKVKGYVTNYSKYLINLYTMDIEKVNKETLYNAISIENQEALLANMIIHGNNRLDTKSLQ